MFTNMFYLLFTCFIGITLEAEFILPGLCPKIAAMDNIDFIQFTGIWYTTAVYASDGRPTYDCSILDFQEDNLGYTLRETYVDIDNGDQIQKTYFARIDRIHNLTNNEARYIVSHTENDKVLQFPFLILSTDYTSYALTYTCKSRKKPKSHYVFAWILSRSKGRLSQNKIEGILTGYKELMENLFVQKDFADKTCNYNIKSKGETFTDNFW